MKNGFKRMISHKSHVQNNLYLLDLSDENVHLSSIFENRIMRLENHILLALNRFFMKNPNEKFAVNLFRFQKNLMHIQKTEF